MRRSEALQGVRMLRFRDILGRYEANEFNQIEAAESLPGDTTLVRAARTLGAGAGRAFLTIQLPLAARGITAALMLAFARSLGDFGITLMVAGDIPGETQTASLAIYDAMQEHKDQTALLMVLVLTTIAMSILYTVNKLSSGASDAR